MIAFKMKIQLMQQLVIAGTLSAIGQSRVNLLVKPVCLNPVL